MTQSRLWRCVLILGLLLSAPPRLGAQSSIVGSKHDLSIAGSRPEVCVFCHTPHGANTAIAAPLWNRFVNPGASFTPYGSSTLNTACPATPSGVSLACLSCHDGGVADTARHQVVNAPGAGTTSPYGGACSRCHDRRSSSGSQLRRGLAVPGTDLRDDHPISMAYPSIGQDPAFNRPPDSTRGWSDLKLYDGRVECATCHNPHDPGVGMFLRKSNAADALCRTCHIK